VRYKLILIIVGVIELWKKMVVVNFWRGKCGKVFGLKLGVNECFGMNLKNEHFSFQKKY
jgi:hypothetical protein